MPRKLKPKQNLYNQTSLVFQRSELLLSSQELSKAWDSLYNNKAPRLHKLKNLSEEEWLYLAELLTETLDNLQQAQMSNQVH